MLRTFSTAMWSEAVKTFRSQMGVLSEKIERERGLIKIPVTLPEGRVLSLSPGPHNELQKAIVEEFLPLAPGSEVVYVGDAHKKSLLVNESKLVELGFVQLEHGILPDVIAYYAKKTGFCSLRRFTPPTRSHNCVTLSWKGSHHAARSRGST